MRRIVLGLSFGMMFAKPSNGEIRQAVNNRKVFIINTDGEIEPKDGTGHEENSTLLPNEQVIRTGKGETQENKQKITDTVKSAFAAYHVNHVQNIGRAGTYYTYCGSCPLQNTLSLVPAIMKGSVIRLKFDKNTWSHEYIESSEIDKSQLLCVSLDDTRENLMIATFEPGSFFDRAAQADPHYGSSTAAKALNEIHDSKAVPVVLATSEMKTAITASNPNPKQEDIDAIPVNIVASKKAELEQNGLRLTQ